MDLTHRFRDCTCPGTPHPSGDTVTYLPRLPFDTAARVIGAISDRSGFPTAKNAFGIYLHETPVSWNVLDAEGDPVPLTEEAIDALDFADQFEIADYADTLYQDAVLAPLVRRTSKPSGTGPTSGSSKRRSRS